MERDFVKTFVYCCMLQRENTGQEQVLHCTTSVLQGVGFIITAYLAVLRNDPAHQVRQETRSELREPTSL